MDYYKKIVRQVVTNPFSSSENKKKPPKQPEIENLEMLSLQDHHQLIESSLSDPPMTSQSILFNLECPISGDVIVKPARGLHCVHTEIFCAISAVEARIRSCPVCHRTIKLK